MTAGQRKKHIDRSSKQQLARDLEILLLSLSLARLWEKSKPLLQAPAQEHLLVLDYDLSFEEPHVPLMHDIEVENMTFMIGLSNPCLSRRDCKPCSYGGDGGLL